MAMIEENSAYPFWQPRNLDAGNRAVSIACHLIASVSYIITGKTSHFARTSLFDTGTPRPFGLDPIEGMEYDTLQGLRCVILTPVETDTLMLWLLWAYGYKCPPLAVLPIEERTLMEDLGLVAAELANRTAPDRDRPQEEDPEKPQIYKAQPGIFVDDFANDLPFDRWPRRIQNLLERPKTVLLIGRESDFWTMQMEIAGASRHWGILSLPKLARYLSSRVMFEGVMQRPFVLSDLAHGYTLGVHIDKDEDHILDRERDIERHKREREQRERTRARYEISPQREFANSAPHGFAEDEIIIRR